MALGSSLTKPVHDSSPNPCPPDPSTRTILLKRTRRAMSDRTIATSSTLGRSASVLDVVAGGIRGNVRAHQDLGPHPANTAQQPNAPGQDQHEDGKERLTSTAERQRACSQ